MRTIKVIVARVGQEPVIEEVEDSLSGMQAVVGGYIERVQLSETVDMWLNEEGRITGLTMNRLVPDEYGRQWDICGDLFLASHNQEGDTVSLSNADQDKWMARIKDAQDLSD